MLKKNTGNIRIEFNRERIVVAIDDLYRQFSRYKPNTCRKTGLEILNIV